MASIPALEFGSPPVAALGFLVGLLATAAILQQLGERAETSCIWTVGMETVIGAASGTLVVLQIRRSLLRGGLSASFSA